MKNSYKKWKRCFCCVYSRKILLPSLLAIAISFSCSLSAMTENIVMDEQKPLPEDSNPANLKAVSINDDWGFADSKGNIVIPPFFQYANDFMEGLGQIRISDKWGYINETGKIIINPVYDAARSFSKGLAPVGIKEGNTLKWGYIDTRGNKKIDFKYTEAHRFYENLAAVSETGKEKSYGYIDQNGTYKIKPGEFDDAMSFTEGLAAVNCNGKWGYINHEGKIVIPCSYEHAEHFSQGLAAVLINHKWGYITQEGKVAITPEYEFASNFTDRGALVSKEGKSFIIDNHGAKIQSLMNDKNGQAGINYPDDNSLFIGYDMYESNVHHCFRIFCLTIVNLTGKEINVDGRYGLWKVAPSSSTSCTLFYMAEQCGGRLGMTMGATDFVLSLEFSTDRLSYDEYDCFVKLRAERYTGCWNRQILSREKLDKYFIKNHPDFNRDFNLQWSMVGFQDRDGKDYDARLFIDATDLGYRVGDYQKVTCGTLFLSSHEPFKYWYDVLIF